MPNYFYAYHGPKNGSEFCYHTGYGVSKESKQSQTRRGDFVFIIQKRPSVDCFQLCGVFKIVSHYYDEESARPYRMKLEDVSKLTTYIDLDEDKISRQLPQIKGDKRWSNFKRHFCRQGVSFQSSLNKAVVDLLNTLVLPRSSTIEDNEEKFNLEVERSLNSSEKARAFRLKKANKKPEKCVVAITTFKRNPDVVATVLLRAGGKCEACGNDAPFKKRKDNTPYLEVHHIVRLADNGDDTVENAIALCPNCHRKQHFG
ncbi:HNH endonuclease [Halomonas qinghailakensis]|uniref:HNH endonuclease n=1 Tax=Halomonas qinghailakensis TaxID=2937790 RepID=A0AA46YPU7_9GAMM|nr:MULTISPECIES: HNH endonuclease signature motif containing protein [Halomonas]UYO74003.1 HNH endonuclease [Halomonas sp. ZZQ-149]